MSRFVALAIPLALLVLSLGASLLDLAGWAPDLGPLAARGVARPDGAPLRFALASRLIEATALTALTLLLFGRTARWWSDAVACGLIAWLFRGPLLVLAVATLTRLPTTPFATLARGALALDLAAALALGGLARVTLAPPAGES